MKTSTLYKATSRGHKYHGWLDTYHTFSFAEYYDPKRMHFGALRVVNDDLIKGGEGFGMHPHDNMEIITIPFYGDLEHQDSMGNRGIIKAGDIQVMSAGTGVLHSEYNPNREKPVNLFQIWVFPNKKDVSPRYQQLENAYLDKKDILQQIISPNQNDEGLWIYQDAWFNIGLFDKDYSTEYSLKNKNNGIFVMIIDGEFIIDEQKLSKRDALTITEVEKIEITSLSPNARVLLIEVPMKI